MAADEAAVENAKLELMYCHITLADRRPHRPDPGQPRQRREVRRDDARGASIRSARSTSASRFRSRSLPEVRRRAAAGPLLVDAYPDKEQGQPVAGELSFIDNQVHTDSGTVLLKGLFANDDEALWPGQFVETVVTLSRQPKAVVVPNAAVQTGQQGAYVYVIDADRHRRAAPGAHRRRPAGERS